MKNKISRIYNENEYNSLCRFINYAVNCKAFGKELQNQAYKTKRKINKDYLFVKDENELKIKIIWSIKEIDELAFLYTEFLTLMEFQNEEDPNNYFENIIKKYKETN